MNKNASELLNEIKEIKLNIECLLRNFNNSVARENNTAYFCGYDENEYINYKDRYAQLQEELNYLKKELPKLFDSTLNELEELGNHSCTYEDGYCTICGRDGYA